MPPIETRFSPHWSGSFAKGDEALVANTAYRRYLKTISEDHFATIRQGRGGKGFDGIFVLRTNTDLNPLEASVNAETGV